MLPQLPQVLLLDGQLRSGQVGEGDKCKAFGLPSSFVPPNHDGDHLPEARKGLAQVGFRYGGRAHHKHAGFRRCHYRGWVTAGTCGTLVVRGRAGLVWLGGSVRRQCRPEVEKMRANPMTFAAGLPAHGRSALMRCFTSAPPAPTRPQAELPMLVR